MKLQPLGHISQWPLNLCLRGGGNQGGIVLSCLTSLSFYSPILAVTLSREMARGEAATGVVFRVQAHVQGLSSDSRLFKLQSI